MWICNDDITGGSLIKNTLIDTLRDDVVDIPSFAYFIEYISNMLPWMNMINIYNE